MSELLNNLNFYILPLGLGRKRMKFFQERIKDNGGNITNDNLLVTHVLIEDSMMDSSPWVALKNNNMDKIQENNGKYLKISWLSDCLKWKNLLDTKNYEINVKGMENRRDRKREEKLNEMEVGETSSLLTSPPKKKSKRKEPVCLFFF